MERQAADIVLADDLATLDVARRATSRAAPSLGAYLIGLGPGSLPYAWSVAFASIVWYSASAWRAASLACLGEPS